MNDPDFKDLGDQTASLPREIAPPRNLWPQIRAQLHASPGSSAPASPVVRSWLFRVGLAAAALLIIGAALFFSSQPTGMGWSVVSISGVPRVDATPLAGEGTWRTGQWLETDASSRAKLNVGNIGEVRVEPNSRIRLLATAARDHRLELARGTLHALIWAPPRLFFVETPSATAVDLGCAYTLTVDDAGVGTLRVTSGYVALEHAGRESLIPAGLTCLTRKGVGPGTPFSENTSPDFRAALQRFDFNARGNEALTDVLAHAKQGDEVTLWHLLTRVSAGQRSAVFEKLAALQPAPTGVTKAGILAGEKDMLSDWGRELGLPNL